MNSVSQLADFVAATPVVESIDRHGSRFVRKLPSPLDAPHAGHRPAQSGSRVSATLTARERDVLAMISQGSSNKSIARVLKISPETVKSHVRHICSKLAVSTRAGAAFRAAALGLL